MKIEIALADHLELDPGVTAIAGTRVYQLLTPQNETEPALRLQLIDQPELLHLRGKGGVFRSRVQIDAFAAPSETVSDPYQTVSDLSDAVDAAFGMQPFTPPGSPALQVLMVKRLDRRPFDPDEHRNYRMMSDYEVWHRE